MLLLSPSFRFRENTVDVIRPTSSCADAFRAFFFSPCQNESVSAPVFPLAQTLGIVHSRPAASGVMPDFFSLVNR